MSNETNETPVQGRKVGIARFFELLGRDLWPLYKSGILCVLGFLPGTALAVFGMMAGSALLTVVGGVVGGLVGGPFLSGMIDTVLRALRDEPGYWWNTYKRAWKQNWRQSLVPGALLGLFVGSWAWMLRAQAESGNTSTALWVASLAGIFVCTGFFTWLLAQVPLVDLPLAQIAKNAGLMFFGLPAHRGGGAGAGPVLGRNAALPARHDPDDFGVRLLAARHDCPDDRLPGSRKGL